MFASVQGFLVQWEKDLREGEKERGNSLLSICFYTFCVSGGGYKKMQKYNLWLEQQL